jgi:hypothetical protein
MDFGNNIVFMNGASLVVENCLFTRSSSGINFAPAAAAQLVVTDSLFTNSISNSVGGGIVVKPSGAATAVVSLERVTMANNAFGIAFDGSGSTGGIAAMIKNSTFHRNSQDGIVATTPAGGAPIGLMVENTRSVSNNIGIRAIGPGATIRVDGSTVMHNGTGVVASSGGAVLTYGTNKVLANGTNGAFSGSVGLQ